MTGPAPDQAAARPDPRKLRGDQYPFPDAPPARISDYVRKLMRDTEADATARYKIAARNMMFVDGRQHIDWSLRELAWQDAPSAPGDIRIVANYIRPILRSRLSRLMSGDFVWRAVPRSNADEDRDNAAVAQDLLTSRWDGLLMDNKLRYALWLAFSSGSSFLKSFWNPNLGSIATATVQLPLPQPDGSTKLVAVPVGPDGNPLLNPDGTPGDPANAYRYHIGDTDTAVRSLFNLRINPEAYGFDVSEGMRWLLDSEVVARSVVQERYGIELQTAKSMDGVQQGRWERLVRTVAMAFGTGADRLASSESTPDPDSVLLTEYWEPPSEVMPKGRLIVLAGEQVVYPPPGEEGPLPQGIVPYVPIYDERRPFDACGRGSVNDLVPPQRVVNRMESLILQELRAEGTGQWIGFDLPGVFDQISNVPNAHVKLPWSAQTASLGLDRMLSRVPKAQINQAWLEMLAEAKAQLFDIGAYHEIQRGQVPPGVDSGVAVQHLMEAENAQLDDSVRTLKHSCITWGRHQLTLARWGYGANEQRWLRVHRDDLGYQLEDMNGVDLPDPDMVDIDLDGFAPASKAAQRADIKDLMDKGQIPPDRGLKLLDLGRGVDGIYESQTRHYAKARTENLAFEKGAVQVVEPPGEEGKGGLPVFMNADGSPLLLSQDDDHQLHIERHLEIALDTSKPWPLRQALLLHIEAHRQATQMQMMMAQDMAQQMAPPEAPTGKANGKAPSHAR